MATVDAIAHEAGEAKTALKRSLAETLRAYWASLTSHHKSSVELFVREAVPTVLAHEQVMAETTFNYLKAQYEELGQEFDARLREGRTTGAVIRNGVPPQQVYARPFVDVWTALDDGLSLPQAIDRGATRLDQLADVDIELTHDWTVRDIVGQTRLAGYRRVLNGATNCALCIVASTQRYRRGDLKKMHPGCNCTVAPIITDEDVHQVLDEDLLAQVHAEIAEKFGTSASDARRIDYRKILLTRQHGEYGPTLTYSTDKFTGPSGLSAIRP